MGDEDYEPPPLREAAAMIGDLAAIYTAFIYAVELIGPLLT
jgi:hypothetical protein